MMGSAHETEKIALSLSLKAFLAGFERVGVERVFSSSFERRANQDDERRMPVSANVVYFLACACVNLLVMLLLGLLCFWASYRLGRRLRLTDQVTTLVLGIGVFPLPFMIASIVAIGILLHLLHLPHNGNETASGWTGTPCGIAVGGWMGAGAARLENLKPQGVEQ